MYINKLMYENVGPIKNINIDFSFSNNGNPKPILFVGENGSGKSTIISSIVDSFYEMAGKAFDNARERNDTNGSQYFKAIIPIEINSDSDYMFSYICFNDNKNFAYISKCGNLSPEILKNKINTPEFGELNIEDRFNYKTTTIDKKDAEHIWNNNVICYFGPDRYEKPIWLGNRYYKVEDTLHPTIRERWSGELYNNISVKDVTTTNQKWLLDVILDSRPDIKGDKDNLSLAYISTDSLIELRKARENLELIMSEIIGEDVYFGLNLRNSGQSRLKILKKADNSIIAPSLNSLSTGQIALFNLFSTIVRYADVYGIKNSISLNDISGIVVIDEIELHLHAKLQREVLPLLIKLFPRVQFFITTHAPLFLLGMQETFGDDKFDVYELPTATKITVERFSEFQRAYDYFKMTQTYQNEAQEIIKSVKVNSLCKTLIITEGSTDWIHMKTAFEVLKSEEKYASLLQSLDFDFLEYEPKNSISDNKYKIDMGNKTLTGICENYAKLPHDKKYIFIADRDVDETNKKMSIENQPFKKWAENVYSFIIPLPDSRKDTPNICIEHLYSDEEIKTEIICDGISRRLYMGNEFDCRGLALSIDRFCERANICGPDKINIIEGTQGDRVTSINNIDHVTNYALSKMNFAKHISDNPDKFNFENFIEIFKTIKCIIEDDNKSD